MKFARRLARTFDPVRLAKRSRIRIGREGIRIDGMPAILVGVASIVGVACAARALERSAPLLPEALRESRALLRALRGDHRELAP